MWCKLIVLPEFWILAFSTYSIRTICFSELFFLLILNLHTKYIFLFFHTFKEFQGRPHRTLCQLKCLSQTLLSSAFISHVFLSCSHVNHPRINFFTEMNFTLLYFSACIPFIFMSPHSSHTQPASFSYATIIPDDSPEGRNL